MAHLEDHIKRGNGGLPSETDFHSGTRINEQPSNQNKSSNNNIDIRNFVPKLIEPISAAAPETITYNRSSKRKVIQKGHGAQMSWLESESKRTQNAHLQHQLSKETSL
ncbi:unnamed protein product [Oikopleura dioica]|uniref:Uncharacterized protein n=1 Tax=Oikopleura dioica TaxID=34765 RepID=E4XIT1_OIKDI|nr:unnamed protein product [Oikopleura dioica]CBY35539.1 unnamed protein product [Oikopleura dioica]